MSSATVESTIKTQLAAVQQYASGAVDQVNTLTEALADMVESINADSRIGWSVLRPPQWADLAKVDAEGKPAPLDLSSAFTLLSVGADRPDSYTPGTLPTISPFNLTAFSGTAPELDLPTKPGVTLPDAPESSAVTLPDMPVAPDYVLPAVPTLASLTLPDAPDFTAVAPFSETAPSLVLAAPQPVLNYTEQTYTSELQTLADAWLQSQITNGGTGLEADVENAIWTRGMTREAVAARRNLENAQDEFAAAGYPMPPGALRARMREIRADLQNRSEDLSRKISEDQAKLAQENIKFAIDAALRLEALTLQHFNNIADRALRYAQASVDVALAVFNARVAEYNVQLEVYKAKAQVHEINVRTALQDIEAYRALLSGKQIEGSLRMQDVELYRAQIAGAEALFGLYRTQLEGTKVEGDIERLKLDIFRAEMDGYIAQIRAKESEYAIYQAEINGEKTKIEAFSAAVSAYRAQAEAQSAFTDAQKAQVQAAVEVERGRIEQVKTQLAVYLADIDRNKSAINALIDIYRVENDAYKAEIGRAEAEARMALQGLSIETQTHLANVSEMNAKFRREADLLRELTAIGVTGTTAAAQLQADIAASALSQVTTIAQLSAGFETVE